MAQGSADGRISVGILTVSDSCSEGTAEDKSGPNLRSLIEEEKLFNGKVVEQQIVPDEQDLITEKLRSWSDDLSLDVILTTGGTGFAPRDVTPEATKSVVEKEAIGMTVAMVQGSLAVTPLAMLSRAVCGTRGTSLIINLPGSKKGSQECLGFVASAIPHAVDLLNSRKKSVSATHTQLQQTAPQGDNDEDDDADNDDEITQPLTTDAPDLAVSLELEVHSHDENISHNVQTSTHQSSVERMDFHTNNRLNRVNQPIKQSQPASGKTCQSVRHDSAIQYGMFNDICQTEECAYQWKKTADVRDRSVSFEELVNIDDKQGTVSNRPNLKKSVKCPNSSRREIGHIQGQCSAGENVPSQSSNVIGNNCNQILTPCHSMENNENICTQSNHQIINSDHQQTANIAISSESSACEITECHGSMIIRDDDYTGRTCSQSVSDVTVTTCEVTPCRDGKVISGDGDLTQRSCTQSLPDVTASQCSESHQFHEITPGVATNTQAHLNQPHYDIFEFEVETTLTDTASRSQTLYKHHRESNTSALSVQKSQIDVVFAESASDHVLQPKLHKRNRTDGDIHYVGVGQGLKRFLGEHSMVRRLYLNRGKRDLKKKLVCVKRQEGAVDTGGWKRGRNFHQRNRLDDMFEVTAEGKAKQDLILEKRVRDEYVVNWYLWCPGHGNCQRKCGGYGTCVQGCGGSSHKQDRHNCSVLINLKLFLSDLSSWRVHISGNHVPVDAAVLWQPPPSNRQRIDEDMRDVIVSFSQKATPSQIVDILSQKRATCGPDETPSRKRVSCFVSGIKKRRRERAYYDDAHVESSQPQTCAELDDGDENEACGVYKAEAEQMFNGRKVGGVDGAGGSSHDCVVVAADMTCEQNQAMSSETNYHIVYSNASPGSDVTVPLIGQQTQVIHTLEPITAVGTEDIVIVTTDENHH